MVSVDVCLQLLKLVKANMVDQDNQTVLERWKDELPESTVYWMLIAIVCAHAWTIYLTYYNSRVIGLILTAILNRFIKYGSIKLGTQLLLFMSTFVFVLGYVHVCMF